MRGHARPEPKSAVASVALTGDGHEGETYTLTGPEVITFEGVAGHLSEAVRREIECRNVPDEAALQGLPEYVAAQIVAVFGVLRGGVQERTTGTVLALTGREPRGFAELRRSRRASLAAPCMRLDPQTRQAISKQKAEVLTC